jgi:hypothetical protein
VHYPRKHGSWLNCRHLEWGLPYGEISEHVRPEAHVEEKARYNEIVKSEPEASSQTWFDETLSEEGLAAKERMLETLWQETQRKDLNMDQIAAQPYVWEYAATRIEIINILKLARSEGDQDGSRLSHIESGKRKVLALVSNEYFIGFLKRFGITEDHPLSPANLLPKEIAQVSNNPGEAPTSVNFAKLLPHYTSPWKNAILLALLAKGLDADYRATAAYMSECFQFVQLPDYFAGHGKGSIHYLVESVPDISEAFQKDRTRVKKQLESRLEQFLDSLASQKSPPYRVDAQQLK